MLLSFVILYSHFVWYISGSYWKYTIAVDIEQKVLSTIEEWFLSKNCKPPDPIHRIVTLHCETLGSKCNDESSHPFTYTINTSTTYRVSQQKFIKQKGSLIDCGANGSLAGSDVRVISQVGDNHKVNVKGIDNHQLTDMPIVTAVGVITTQKGPVIAIMNQYTHINCGHTIHSSG